MQPDPVPLQLAKTTAERVERLAAAVEALDARVAQLEASRSDRSAPEPADELDPADVPLYEQLHAWRLDRAKALGRSSFTILKNKQLAALATQRPISALDLAGVIGYNAALKWGDELLPIIQASREW